MTSTSVIANVIPPSDNSGSTVVSPNIATTLTKKQKKAIAVAEQKELNLARISSANKTILSYDDAMVMTTSPDVKPFIKATDMNISNNNTFRIGDYVDVQADFSRGCNRPAGCGFVEEIGANFVCVRYTPAHDGGRRHNKIPTSKAISAVLHQDMMMKQEGRDRANRDESRRQRFGTKGWTNIPCTNDSPD